MAKQPDISRGSWLLAEELLERGDAAFVDELRKIAEPDKLGMLDEVALRIVAQIVREWVRNGRMFTAQDVAAEARLRGGTLSDIDVRNRLLELFQQGLLSGEYTWTHVDLGGVNLGSGERVHLFHRLGDQPWQYRGPRGTTASPPPPQAPQSLWSWLLSVFFGSVPEV